MDKDVQHLRDVMDERDRRYAEVAAAQARAVDAAFASAKEAVLKAEAAAQARFEAVNEFRGQLADQAGTFIPRNEAEQRLEAMRAQLQLQVDGNAAQIAQLMRADNLRSGSSAQRLDSRTVLLAVVGLLFTVAIIVLSIVSLVTR